MAFDDLRSFMRALDENGQLLKITEQVKAEPDLAALLHPDLDEERLGAVLWQIVAIAHQHDLNAENALRSYTVQAVNSGTGPPV